MVVGNLLGLEPTGRRAAIHWHANSMPTRHLPIYGPTIFLLERETLEQVNAWWSIIEQKSHYSSVGDEKKNQWHLLRGPRVFRLANLYS